MSDAWRAAAQQIAADTVAWAVGIGCHVGRWEQCDRRVERVYDVLVNRGSRVISPSGDALPDCSAVSGQQAGRP